MDTDEQPPPRTTTLRAAFAALAARSVDGAALVTRNFQAVHVASGFDDGDTVASYVEAVAADARAWLSRLPATMRSDSALRKPRTMLANLLKMPAIRRDVGEAACDAAIRALDVAYRQVGREVRDRAERQQQRHVENEPETIVMMETGTQTETTDAARTEDDDDADSSYVTETSYTTGTTYDAARARDYRRFALRLVGVLNVVIDDEPNERVRNFLRALLDVATADRFGSDDDEDDDDGGLSLNPEIEVEVAIG